MLVLYEVTWYGAVRKFDTVATFALIFSYNIILINV